MSAPNEDDAVEQVEYDLPGDVVGFLWNIVTAFHEQRCRVCQGFFVEGLVSKANDLLGAHCIDDPADDGQRR